MNENIISIKTQKKLMMVPLLNFFTSVICYINMRKVNKTEFPYLIKLFLFVFVWTLPMEILATSADTLFVKFNLSYELARWFVLVIISYYFSYGFIHFQETVFEGKKVISFDLTQKILVSILGFFAVLNVLLRLI